MTAAAPTPLVEKLAEALSPLDAFERLAGLPYILFLDSAAENDTQGRYSYITARPFEVLKTSGDTTELLAKAAMRMFHAVGTSLNSHASRDLGHRCEQGKAPMWRSDCFVRDTDCAAFYEIDSLLGIWCEV